MFVSPQYGLILLVRFAVIAQPVLLVILHQLDRLAVLELVRLPSIGDRGGAEEEKMAPTVRQESKRSVCGAGARVCVCASQGEKQVLGPVD